MMRAYERAGIGPSDIDVAEVHDATSFGEIYQAEMLRFCEVGEGGDGGGGGWAVVVDGVVVWVLEELEGLVVLAGVVEGVGGGGEQVG